ncbi:hypothetical protein BSKO_09140 [Bryopsis sp. KO-2023]|nr:hypothetical protein BSKO_09140 [Bryopsis sp. KO-2023]
MVEAIVQNEPQRDAVSGSDRTHSEPARSPRCKKARLESCQETSDDDVLVQFLSRVLVNSVPTFRPSEQDFQDPYVCIRKVEALAGRCGACKIIPPPGVSGEPLTSQDIITRAKDFEFPIFSQKIRQPAWNDFQETCLVKKPDMLSAASILERSDSFAESLNLTNISGDSSKLDEIECEYWRTCGQSPGARCKQEFVDQPAAIAGSAFLPTDNLSQTRWNFKNLKADQRFLFKHLGGGDFDLGSPRLALGCLFGTNFWKRSHGNFQSLEFLHGGAPRIFYTIPPEYGDIVEEIIIRQVYRKAMGKLFKKGKSWENARRKAFQTLSKNYTTLLPKKLVEEGIPVFRTVQAPGEMISILPGSFHMSFSAGFNCHESLDLATTEWLFHGKRFLNRARAVGLPIRIPYEEMLCKEAILTGLLLKTGGIPTSSQFLVMRMMVEFLSEQQSLRRLLSTRGASEGHLDGGVNMSGNCQTCGYACFLGLVVEESSNPEPNKNPNCLSCAARDPNCGKGATLFLKKQFDELDNMSKVFRSILAKQGNACGQVSSSVQPVIGFLNTPDLPLRLVEHISINCLNGFRDRRVFVSPNTPTKAYVIAADVIQAMGMKDADRDETVMADVWMEVNRSFEGFRIPPPPFPLKAYYEGRKGEVGYGVVLSSAEVDVVLKTVQGAAFVGLSQFIAGIRPASVNMGGGSSAMEARPQ